MTRQVPRDPGDTVRAGSPSPSSEELRETEGTVRKRLLWATAGIGLLLLLSGCAPDATQDTLQPQGPYAQKLKDLFIPVFWVAVFVFIVVEGAIVWIAIRYRHRKGRDRGNRRQGQDRSAHQETVKSAQLGLLLLPDGSIATTQKRRAPVGNFFGTFQFAVYVFPLTTAPRAFLKLAATFLPL